jgi:hypothetical protein
MDQKKNQGQGSQGQRTQGQGKQVQGNQPPNPHRDQADDQRQPRNSSSSGGGISNRGMDSDEEQEDVPARGWDRDSDGDSER